MCGLSFLFGFKYFLLQIPVFVICAVLYVRMVLVLTTGSNTNSRKRNLSVAFCALWVTWVIFTTPYALYEIYEFFYSHNYQRFFKYDIGNHFGILLTLDGECYWSSKKKIMYNKTRYFYWSISKLFFIRSGRELQSHAICID